MNEKDLEKLVFGISHQVRNPCAIILANTNLLFKRCEKDATAVRSLEAIATGVKYIETRLDEFIEFSKPLIPKLEDFSVHQLSAECISIVKERCELQKTRIVCDVKKDLPLIRGDHQHLLLAQLNVMMNAIESIKMGGTITLTAAAVERGVKLVTQDSGCGIHPRDLPEIFSPFYSTKEGGIGIGLSVAKKMLEASNAKIDVASEFGKGTTVTIRFSLAS